MEWIIKFALSGIYFAIASMIFYDFSQREKIL